MQMKGAKCDFLLKIAKGSILNQPSQKLTSWMPDTTRFIVGLVKVAL